MPIALAPCSISCSQCTNTASCAAEKAEPSGAFDIFEPRPPQQPSARPAADPTRKDFSVNNRDASAVSQSLHDVKSMKGKSSYAAHSLELDQRIEQCGILIFLMLSCCSLRSCHPAGMQTTKNYSSLQESLHLLLRKFWPRDEKVETLSQGMKH